MRSLFLILTLLAIGFYFIVSPSTTEAACLPIFNGGKNCTTSKNVTIVKEVKNPKTGTYVGSLSSIGPFYSPSQRISFRITVQNTSKNMIKDITIVDTLPQYFIFLTGNGKFDTNKKTLTTTIAELKAQEKRSYEITGSIASMEEFQKLSSNMNCFINQVTLTSRGNTAQNNTQYCVNKSEIAQTISPTTTPQARTISPSKIAVYQPSPTSKTPATGAGTLSILTLIPTALIGWYIKRKSA